jgi:hypothetical protein
VFCLRVTADVVKEKQKKDSRLSGIEKNGKGKKCLTYYQILPKKL